MTVLPQLEERLTQAVQSSQARRRPTSRRRGRRVALVLAATFAVSATALAATQPWTSLDDAVNHGQRPPAPDRTLPVIGAPGTESLAQFHGKVVVLSFFASWCEPCQRQASLLDQTGRSLAADGKGTALLINWHDAPEAASAFITTHNLAMPVVADTQGQLAQDYDVQALPETFVIDTNGRVVAISRQMATQQFLDDAIAKAQQPAATDQG